MNLELEERLKQLREEIRNSDEAGKVGAVCSDAVILELARQMPKNIDELLCVKGVGKAFADKYGEEFLQVISSFSQTKGRILSREVKDTLKNLENRLVNINKRNRLLYMPKLSVNLTCDLIMPPKNAKAEAFNQRLAEFVRRFDKAKRLAICDIATGDKDSQARYTAISKVIRESQRSLRETGENSLYIAYPFVIGKVRGEDFTLRAPLVLFPVEVIKETESIVITMDTSKDILFNSSLLLLFNKFSGKNEALPSNVFEDISSFKFIEQIIKFYEKSGINLKKGSERLETFDEYTNSTFPKLKSGEYRIDENIVLGKFPMYSSALQRDFDEIKNAEQINELLNGLLQRYEDVDFYSDSEEIGGQVDSFLCNEKNLNYINDLNMSQEAAIFSINSGKSLVIQGPPGTGKSQTITSLIADFVNKGKNVLMVSQKKAALDVIYSRLGKLNKFALFIPDVKDKEYFYEQLYSILNNTEADNFSQEDFDNVSVLIDSLIKKLDLLAEAMFYDDKYGAGIYKIYEENTDSVFREESATVKKSFSNGINEDFIDLGYEKIKKLRRYFDSPEIVDYCSEYYALKEKFDWLENVREGSSRLQIEAKLKELDYILDLYVANKSKVPTLSRLTAGKYKRTLKSFLKNNFAHFDKKLFKKFIKDPVSIYNGFDVYTEFFFNKSKFDELKDEQQLFFEVVYNISKLVKADVSYVLKFIVDFCAIYYIGEFESAHREAIGHQTGFNLTVRDIKLNIEKKKELSRERLKSTLIAALKNDIIASKRAGDISRIVESKRKWDIARFVKKFSFELFKGIKIWLMTPEVVSEVLPLENGLFDLLIFDEASQIYIEKGIPSIARAKKVVIAGDHKQLRPSSLGVGRMDYDDEASDDDSMNAALEEESLLDLARFKYPEILLDYHYRSRYEELIAFSNYAFYKGRLNVSPNTHVPPSPPIQVHYCSDGMWNERINQAEAQKVVALVKDIIYTRKQKETIGVITFNSSQRDLILDMLDELCSKDSDFAAKYLSEIMRTDKGEDVGLFIKNIENVQGDERDIIIFSLAYAKNQAGKVVRNFGWLNQAGGENRLNVAISRAKQKIHVVTSLKANELKVDDLQNEGPRIFKKYIDYAYFISDGNSQAAKEVLHSFGSFGMRTSEYNDEFLFDVAKKLMESGLNIERNVGIGGYKIDMAVRDSGGKYLLGLECDSNLYRLIGSARERDVHRNKYLTSRGWKIHRIWSSNWWSNKEKEIEKIKSLLY